MANKNSINNSEINVEQLYDASGNMIYPLIRFDSRYSVSSPEQLSFPADGEIAYNLKHGVPRFYADKLIEDVEITTDFKSRQIAAYQGNNNESYPLMVFSTAKGDLYSFVPKGTFATEEYVNDEISKVQIGSGGNVDIEALKKYIDGLIDDKLDNVDGNENVNALTIMAYKATDSSLTPDTPIGGSWTRGNDGKIEIDYPDGWGSPSSDEAVNGKYLWTSSSIQMSDGKFLSGWTLPLCINSDDTLYSDAASVFTSFAFTRNNKNLYNITVTGGDYNNPIPTKETHTIGGLDVEVEWYDTVPTNSEEIVWMVKRTFSSNEGDSIDKVWSKPVQMTDTTDFEVIYSAVEAYNSIPDSFSKAEDGVSINSSWLEDASIVGWYDDPEDCLAKDASGNLIKMPPIWMATSKCHNGDWSEWNIVQIKGEDGKDGTKINIKGTYDKYEDLYMAWKNDKTNYAAGDSYVVSFVNVDSSNNWIKPTYNEETQEWTNPTDNSKDGMQGVLFVYDGSDEWIFSGQFKGDSAFIHIKYANDASANDKDSFNISIDGKIITVVPTEPNGEEPGKYIGIYTDNKLEDSSDYTKNYKWSLLKGEDGWGYEYIYYLCAEEPEGGVPTPHYNESDEFFNSDEYQKDDYVPSGWTDSQSGVSAENPFEYVCHRKYVDGKWGKFIGSASDNSIAALCSKYGKDGIDAIQPAAVYKSIVFTRTDIDISKMVVEGGTYDNPIPNEKLYNDVSIKWYDSVPEGKSLLWATSRIFSTDVNDPLATDWSAPVKMADSIDLEIIYSAYTKPGEIPDNFSKAEDDVSINEDWLNAANADGWFDEPEQCKNKDGIIATPIWMATSEKSNGVWSEWNIMQIKGEDGKDGTSINVIDSYPTYEDLYNATANNPENFNQGDAYVVEVVKIDKNGEWINPYDENGNLTNGTNTELKEGESYLRGVLFVYDGSDDWKFCGQFKGDSAFIHIKYAELSAEGTDGAFKTTIDGTDIWLAFTSNNGEIPGKYVGMYTDNLIDDSADPSLYKWSKWQGEDGWGYEYVYLRTNSADAPPVPDYSTNIDNPLYQKDDFIPGVTDKDETWKGTEYEWTDSQSGVTQTDQYEYVCHRKYVDGKWSNFYGSNSNPGLAALCSKFGQDGQPGQDGKTIEYIYLLKKSKPDLPTYTPEFMDKHGDKYQKNDFIPGVTDYYFTDPPGWTADQWRDSPEGINENNPIEWFCTRKRDKKTQEWGAFEGPAIWSKWGVNGQDGDGVQYIYVVTADNTEMPDNPTPGNYKTDENYQDKNGEWGNGKPVTINSGTSTRYTWSDDPQGVSINMKTEWVSVRKYRDSSWGPYSDPKPWAMFGKEGTNGANLRTMYGAFSDASTKEEIEGLIIKDNIDPGSVWGYTKDFEQGEKLWSIYAYTDYSNNLVEIYDSSRNETIYGWQGPFVAATYGKAGADGRTPNYVTYVYASGDNTIINKPTIKNLNNVIYPIDTIWYDYPNDPNNPDNSIWYQCVGTVDGATNDVSWGKVIPLNGRDGVAKDGKYYETRFRKFEKDEEVTINSSDREPDGWSLPSYFQPGELSSGDAIYQTNALIDFSEDASNGKIVGEWCTPFKISGETGPTGGQGPTGDPGPTGLTGLPGTGFELRYCLGKINDPNTTEDDNDGKEYQDNILNVEDASNYDSSGWYKTADDIYSEISEDWPYVYCVQGEKTYTRDEDNEEVVTTSITWGKPFRLSGLNGMRGVNGADGKNGQIVYPAGVYNPNIEYKLDDYKAPYVYDPKYGKYYVLNTESWLGGPAGGYPTDSPIIPDQNGLTPGEAYEWWPDGRYWQLIDNYEAIFAKVGIISNGMVGSAVFNGDYMFSQQGVRNPKHSISLYKNFHKTPVYNATYVNSPNTYELLRNDKWYEKERSIVKDNETGLYVDSTDLDLDDPSIRSRYSDTSCYVMAGLSYDGETNICDFSRPMQYDHINKVEEFDVSIFYKWQDMYISSDSSNIILKDEIIPKESTISNLKSLRWSTNKPSYSDIKEYVTNYNATPVVYEICIVAPNDYNSYKIVYDNSIAYNVYINEEIDDKGNTTITEDIKQFNAEQYIDNLLDSKYYVYKYTTDKNLKSFIDNNLYKTTWHGTTSNIRQLSKSELTTGWSTSKKDGDNYKLISIKDSETDNNYVNWYGPYNIVDDTLPGYIGVNDLNYINDVVVVQDSSYQLFNADDPYGDSTPWHPSYCVNFANGQVWSGTGNVVFNSDGSGKLAGGKIWWDNKGNLHMPITGSIYVNFKIEEDSVISSIDVNVKISNGKIGDKVPAILKFYSDENFSKYLTTKDLGIIGLPYEYNYTFTDVLYAKSVELYVNNELLEQHIIEIPNLRSNIIQISNMTKLDITLTYFDNVSLTDKKVKILSNSSITQEINNSLSGTYDVLNASNGRYNWLSFWSGIKDENALDDNRTFGKGWQYKYSFDTSNHNIQRLYYDDYIDGDNTTDEDLYYVLKWNIFNNSSSIIKLYSDANAPRENNSFILYPGESFGDKVIKKYDDAVDYYNEYCIETLNGDIQVKEIIDDNNSGIESWYDDGETNIKEGTTYTYIQVTPQENDYEVKRANIISGRKYKILPINVSVIDFSSTEEPEDSDEKIEIIL